MSENILIWNVRGLNTRARRDVVREFLLQERASAMCLLETKVDVLSDRFAYDLMGSDFDYVCLPAVGASGGIVVAWRPSVWTVIAHAIRSFSVTVDIVSVAALNLSWSLCAVYGPVCDESKPEFSRFVR